MRCYVQLYRYVQVLRERFWDGSSCPYLDWYRFCFYTAHTLHVYGQVFTFYKSHQLPLLPLLVTQPPRLIILFVIFEAISDGNITKRSLAARLASNHSNHSTILLRRRSSRQSPLNRTTANSFKMTTVSITAVSRVNMIFLLAVEATYFPARIVLRPGHVTTWLCRPHVPLDVVPTFVFNNCSPRYHLEQCPVIHALSNLQNID